MDWSALFPEITDRRELSQLLARLDQIAATAPAAPALVANTGADADAGGRRATSVSDILFAPHEAQLAPVRQALKNSHRTQAHSEALFDQVERLMREFAYLNGLRCVLRLLGERREAGQQSAATPEGRFTEFVSWLAGHDGTHTLAERFPALRPTTAAGIGLRVAAVCELLDRLEHDWPAIISTLPDLPGDDVLVHLETGAGDTHHGGRSVAVLTFSSGRKLVYKPRCLRTEQGFSNLVGWLGERADVPMPVLRHVLGDGYGWVEFVAPGASHHPQYFQMLGVLLACLYLTDAQDVHYENLRHDHLGRPVVIDSEAILGPRLSDTGLDKNVAVAGDPPEPRLAGVLATGLLAQPDPANPTGLDPSALGYSPGSTSAFNGWRLHNPGRDDMFLQMDPIVVCDPDPLPPGARSELLSDRTESALAEGFSRTIGAALEDRHDFTQRLGRWFGGGRARYIHRPTVSYVQLLRMVTHPDLLVHPGDRVRALGRLCCAAPLATPWEFVSAELRALAAGDVPAFHVPNEAPLARVCTAIDSLTADDVAGERDLITSTGRGVGRAG